jgi:hypothetical protein
MPGSFFEAAFLLKKGLNLEIGKDDIVTYYIIHGEVADNIITRIKFYL